MTVDHSADIRRLRATVADLLAFSTLPETWVGREPPAIAAELADLLVKSLHMDFAFVRLSDPAGYEAVEVTQGDSWKAFPEWLEQRLAVLGHIAQTEIVTSVNGGEESCRGVVIPIGVNGERGLIAAAYDRADFPDQIDQLLLSAAANNAAIAFRNARLIAELRCVQDALRGSERELRKARDELEIKVAERTADLQRSEAYLAEAQRLTRTGSWAVNVLTKDVFHSSEEHSRLYGFDPDRGSPSFEELHQRMHPEDRARIDEAFETARRAVTDVDVHYRIVLPDGTIKRLHSVAHPVIDESGEVAELVGTVMDVTEPWNARAELERAFEQIRDLKERLHRENIALREEVDQASMFEEIVGHSMPLRSVLAGLAKVAPTDSTVLITGETGTGKELIARAIHRRSTRAGRAFVSVNCAATPPELIASELFGHERGAFTGATQRRLGRFELAHDGTIFLDEVGELPLEMQIALLRVLQEREFERVGGSVPVRVNVRVIAATNRDLQAAIEAGSFRKDLFYRLDVFPLAVPPLRERADDIPILVEYFISRFARKAGKVIRSINKKSLDRLRAYPWPGNIRELQNVIERSLIVCETEEFIVDENWLSARPAPNGPLALAGNLAGHERALIEEALRSSGGRVFGPDGAATKLGIARSTLESKIRALRIDKRRFRLHRGAKRH
jgi:transcriptional regulator with PAS, ATPase and Fis domain